MILVFLLFFCEFKTSQFAAILLRLYIFLLKNTIKI